MDLEHELPWRLPYSIPSQAFSGHPTHWPAGHFVLPTNIMLIEGLEYYFGYYSWFFQCFQISSLRQSFKEFIDTEKAPFCFKSQLINSSFMTGPSFPPLYKPLPCVYLFIINPGRPCCVTGHVKYSPP